VRKEINFCVALLASLWVVVTIVFAVYNSESLKADPMYFFRQAIPYAFLTAICASIPLIIIFNGIRGCFSRQLPIIWRATVAGLLLVGVLLSAHIYFITKNPVMLGSYNFYDQAETLGPNYDNYVQVQGTWTSDTKLGAPLQVTQVDCWRNTNQCIEMTAYVGFSGGNNLSLFPTYWEIEYWGPDEIRTKDNDSALCATYRMRIDRKGKTITSIRTTKMPRPRGCESLDEAPIVMHLTDGYKLR
jgi:hypothetical protein